MTKLNMTSELSPTCGFRKPDVRKNFLENKYEREKGPSLQFRKLYDCTWVVTTDFYSINLVEGKANETPRDTIFIHDPFHKALYQENSNEIKYPLTFEQDCCDLMSQHCVKSVQIRSFFWSVFPVFGLNTERFRIHSEYGKIRTRKTSYLDTFHTVQPFVKVNFGVVDVPQAPTKAFTGH